MLFLQSHTHTHTSNKQKLCMSPNNAYNLRLIMHHIHAFPKAHTHQASSERISCIGQLGSWHVHHEQGCRHTSHLLRLHTHTFACHCVENTFDCDSASSHTSSKSVTEQTQEHRHTKNKQYKVSSMHSPPAAPHHVERVQPPPDSATPLRCAPPA